MQKGPQLALDTAWREERKVTAKGQRKKTRDQTAKDSTWSAQTKRTAPWGCPHGPSRPSMAVTPAVRQRKTDFPPGTVSPTPGKRKSSRRC